MNIPNIIGTNPTSRGRNRRVLRIDLHWPVDALNSGLFVSCGEGIHPERIIDSYELIFVRCGRLGIFEGKKRFVVDSGRTLILWPGRRHGGTEPYGDDLSFYWVHFMLSASTVRSPAKEKKYAVTVPQLAHPARPDRLTELFRRFMDDQESETLWPVTGSLLVMQMLMEAAYCTAGTRHNDVATALAGRAKTYIDSHFDQPIFAATVARALGYNADYLGRVYRRVYRKTLTTAIHNRRLREAKALLRYYAMNIDQVARASGFEDPGYFRRLFRHYEGMTPREYRGLYTLTHINKR